MNTIPRYCSLCACLIVFATEAAPAVPVTFRLDMSGEPGFNPSDPVDVRGSFNEWSGGANLFPSANPNILTNTFDITNAPGTVEYKFTWNSNWELPNMGNRRFTLTGSPQILPLVYFSDQPPDASATTNSVTFRVSMATQVALGNFNPTNDTDTVWVAGTFQRPVQWTPQLFQLTNSGANNLYIGTYTNDGNYEGTYEEFKFIFRRSDNNNWESVYNRFFILTNHMMLPISYFDNIGNAVPVTFQVDMGVQAAAGRFLTGSEVVECKGSFDGWSQGFVLTNDSLAVNSNLYSGTTYIFDNAGTPEFYKFKVSGDYGRLGWESPASTDGYNRLFVQPDSPITLPPVRWSDWTTADVLPSATVVTFTVNMTNAVGTDLYAFDSSVDSVFLNGDWIPWWSWNTQPLNFQMTNNPPGSKLYTFSLTLPQGYSVPLNYKYSINGGDNEAGYQTNHLRYVRALGQYQLPLDTFGSQLHETSFGNLTIGPRSGGQVPISWLGRPGVSVQTTTNLTSNVLWENLPATEGLNFTNYPITKPQRFFRLTKP